MNNFNDQIKLKEIFKQRKFLEDWQLLEITILKYLIFTTSSNEKDYRDKIK